jgi:hypothetical protein
MNQWSAQDVANYIKEKTDKERLAKRRKKAEAEDFEKDLDDEPDCGGIRDTSRDA